MPDKVLVTGGSGFIGRRVCRLLLERDIRVVILDSKPVPESVVDRFQSGLREDQLTVIEADVTDLEQVESAFLQNRDITRVIHLASRRIWSWVRTSTSWER